jgi:hypothetical protein
MTKDKKEDLYLVCFSGALAAAGACALFAHVRLLGWAAILIVDLYLLVVLVVAGLRTDDTEFKRNHERWVSPLFPRRTAGLLVLLLLLTASVIGFASIYVGTDVFPTEKGRLDALYISLLTIGFSDFSPKSGYGQIVVLLQLCSGIFLLIAAIPLLISRISTFESE